jgi:hypothetical protein
MSHFSDEAWFDFVRQLLSEAETAQMTRHLDEGCDDCQRLHVFWDKLYSITSREGEYEPDESDLRIVKAAYAAELPRLALPKNARLTDIVFDSFLEPAPAGFRGTAVPTRHLLCHAKEWTVALRLTHEHGHGLFIGGQVTQSATESPAEDRKAGPFEVILSQADKFVERVQTNAVGEFYVRSQKDTQVRLYVHVSEQEALEIRLPTP